MASHNIEEGSTYTLDSHLEGSYSLTLPSEGLNIASYSPL